MFARSTGPFDRLLEKATSKLLLDPDWDSVIQICDAIRQGDVQPIYALQGIRKKIENENPHVAKFALQLLESVVKNCGSIVHIEVATREFMDFMKDQAKKRQDPVKAKIVELIQVWSQAFRNEPSYKVVQETFSAMKAEGFAFPALKESDAMFMAEKAPDWRDGELCHRCRVAFTTFNRKHHCRACGQVFCAKCTGRNSIIPKFGIEKEVRVCDSCYEQINKPTGEKKAGEDELPSEYLSSSLAKQSQAPPARSEQEIQEEEELQLALALSQSEAEAKEKERQRMKQGNFGGYGQPSTNDNSSSAIYAQPSKVTAAAAPVIDTSDMDPELARYLNRNYWQQKSVDIKASATQPSAPAAVSEIRTSSNIVASYPAKEEEKLQNGETDDREQFLNALRSSIEIFVNRMKSNSQRGRSIANDSSVQTLFMTLNAMNPQLMRYIQEQEDLRAHYETLQDKLTQLKDARDALDVLREEHHEKRRREQEEMERQRQIQMVQKLEVLRQKKQEYLEFQRQLALQRLQEQEMEMKRRLELQKQEQQMRAMQYGYPQVYGQPGQTFSPSGSTEGSPMHQMHGQMAPGGYPGGQPSISMPPSSGLGMPPPGQPVSTGPQMQQQPQQMNQGTTAPPGGIYTQPGPGYAPQGYHLPHTQGGYPVHMVSGGPSSYQQAGLSQQPGGVYMTAPSVEYQPYNMQGVANSLPQQGQPQSGYMNVAPPQGGYAPQGPPQPPASQPQQPQHQPGPNEAELIMFD